MHTMLKQATEIPQETLEQLRQLISSANWIFAKTYAGSKYEHSYIVKEKNPKEFEALFKAIDEYGFDGMFGKTVQCYLWIDDHKYWHYQIILNREERKVHEAREGKKA